MILNTSYFYHILLFISATLRSLYPILIRFYPNSIFIQTFLRFLTFTIVLGFYLFFKTSFSFKQILTFSYWKENMYPALLQFVHIITSYLSFTYLSPGIAISIFYTYPIFVNIFETYFYKFFEISHTESSKKTISKYLFFALFGVILTQWNVLFSKDIKYSSVYLILLGIFMAFLSSLTEALLTIHSKHHIEKEDSVEYLFNIHSIGTFLILFFLLFYKHKFKLFKPISSTFYIILFNSIIGVLSFYLLILALKNLQIEHFSSIVYIGVIMAYIFGYIFFKIKIEWYHILGTIFILFAIYKNLKI